MPTFDELSAQYASLWDNADIRAVNAAEVKAQASKLLGLRARYDQVSAATNVPWYVIGLIHYRECDFRLDEHLHNGDPLTARTVHEPPGHPRAGQPPFSWVESAIDALTIEGFAKVVDWTVERVAFQLELYNGWGYRSRGVNSPYLWCCTDEYDKGYFVADGKFDPNAVNKQVGTMALLKQLEADGVVALTRQSGAAPKPKPKPEPVPTGLFLVDGDPFGLRKEADDNAEKLLPVLADMPIKKLKEVDATWWQVEVTTPAGSTRIGYAKRAWLKDQIVMSTFEEDLFARTCLSEARAQGTNAHFLIALAHAENALRNAPHPDAANRFGPFALTEEDWAKANDIAKTGYGAAARFDPYAQVTIAASLIVNLTTQLQGELPDKRLPTAEELYLARIFGAKGTRILLDAAQDGEIGKALAATAIDLKAIAASWPLLLRAGISVQDLRAEIRRRLDEGFKVAVDLILAVEPDLVVGPGEATDGEKVPWMAKAKDELSKNIKEFPGAPSNPEVEKYFTATTLGPQHDDVAWCGAFVSWCIKQAGGSRDPINYSARAADWLNNGAKLAGPQYGAIAVTRPYAATSSGHVGFVVSWDGTRVKFLGGNQDDAVCEREFPIADVRGWRMV